jgi:hypothetical protein
VDPISWGSLSVFPIRGCCSGRLALCLARFHPPPVPATTAMPRSGSDLGAFGFSVAVKQGIDRAVTATSLLKASAIISAFIGPRPDPKSRAWLCRSLEADSPPATIR